MCVILYLYKSNYFNTIFLHAIATFITFPLYFYLKTRNVSHLIRHVCYKNVDNFAHQGLKVVVGCTFYILKSEIGGGMISKFNILCGTTWEKIID